MLINHLKISVRYFMKHKRLTFIKIFGLSVGMACFLMVIRFLQYEMSFDGFHKNKDRIYRVNQGDSRNPSYQRSHFGPPLAPLLLDHMPGIENATRISRFEGIAVEKGNELFSEENFLFSDASFLDVFTFPLKEGASKTALTEPFSVLLSPQMAVKYFGDINPVNRKITVSFSGVKRDYRITGIFEEMPRNSHIKIDFLASYATLRSIIGNSFFKDQWDGPTWTYVLLKKGYKAEDLEKRLPEFTKMYVKNVWNFSPHRLFFQPLTDIYYHRHDGPLLGRSGSKGMINGLIWIAAIILIIACINYMNLTTSQTFQRAREIGIRKATGADRLQILAQFLTETLLVSFLALLFAVLLMEFFKPVFLQWIARLYTRGENVENAFSLNINYIFLVFITAICVGVFSGGYPAVFFSSLPPVNSIKNIAVKKNVGDSFRNTLVVLQFVFSIFFIVLTMNIFRQIQYLKNKELGFDQKRIITIPIQDWKVNSKYDLLKDKLLQHSDILGVNASSTKPGLGDPYRIILKSDQTNEKEIPIIFIDPDYFLVLKIKGIRGDNFLEKPAFNAEAALWMNETSAHDLNEKANVGEKMTLYFKDGDQPGSRQDAILIGIVKDFHFRELGVPIQPLLLRTTPNGYHFVIIRLNDGDITQAIQHIKESWREFDFNQPFSFTFLDDDIRQFYQHYESYDRISRNAAFLTIFVACLGLFGLSSFVIERKTKEIGIRKIVGASVPSILFLLTKEWIKWVLLANCIAWPAAYFITDKWLQHFAYRVNVAWWTFMVAGVLALVIAHVTVSWQAIRAAKANPVEALRYE
jgi:putative ABC transport system permease protein